MIRRIYYILLALLAIAILIPALCYAWITVSSRPYLYDDIDAPPPPPPPRGRRPPQKNPPRGQQH